MSRELVMSSYVVFEEFIGKLEVSLPSIHPCALVIEEAIGSLLELLRDSFGFFVSLKPSLILFMESPRLIFQGLGREVLLICALLVIEDVEQRVGVNARVEPGVVEDRQWLLGKL